MPDRAYLDWNATAPLRPEARAAMIAAMDVVGNPSSVHTEGRAAKAIVEKAREQVAALVGCRTSELVFTSGATEAVGLSFPYGPAKILPIEHDCIYKPYGSLEVSEPSPVALSGQVDLAFMSLCPSLDLIALQAANSETGVVQDVVSASEIVEDVGGGAIYLCDAVQVLGKRDFAFTDLRSKERAVLVSGHKFGGPKGVGALAVSEFGIGAEALETGLTGWGQEKSRRPGTENVIGIAGFGAAAEAAQRDLDAGVWEPIAELRDDLEAALRDCSGNDLTIFGEGAPRLPNTSCFAIPGWKGETQVMQLDLAGFAVSAGSACSSGKVGPSRVLKAMGFDDITASSAIRVSMGPTTTKDEVSRFIDAWTGLYRRMKMRAA